MSKSAAQRRWRPTRTNLIAGGLVIGGFLLTEVNWWFFLLVAAGTLGPGILRELGWLRDKDEFQRQAAYRAGYHAFLTVGLVSFLLVAFFRTGGTVEHPHRLVTFILAMLWFTWFFSSLLAYWGAQKTVTRVLIAFGSVLLVFAIISNQIGPRKSAAQRRWRPTRTNLIAGGLVIGGFLLTEVNWWFFLLVAAGTLGPGILRELGWLRDKDEFQRQAAYRAGYHAFLTVGLVSFLLVAFFRTGGTVEHPHRLVTFILAMLWFTWFFSSLLAYWGAQKTVTRVLIAFGSVLLVFAIISNLGPEWTGWAALLLTPLLAAPFFVLAWLSGRWPRITGVLLLIAAAGWLVLELPHVARTSVLEVITDSAFILFFGALLASGVALLCTGKKNEQSEDAQEVLMTEN